MAAAVCGATDCGRPGTKLCGRCGVDAYCSAECQRRAWRSHKLVCQRQDSAENTIAELLRAGRLHSAQEALRQLPQGHARLEAELAERVKLGIHSEIVEGRLKLEHIDGFGAGYVAAKDLSDGDALLFDTAFVWAPIDGEKEFHFLIAEKAMRKGRSAARRTSSRADAQADFYHDRVRALPLKGGMDRGWWLEGAPDEEMREQLLACSVAEGSCLYCSEEPSFVALFAAAAYFNHSCAPNATLQSTRSTALVRAESAISEGTEVTISYLPMQLLGEGRSRRERLQAGRGFLCKCVRCVAEGLVEPIAQREEDGSTESASGGNAGGDS